MSVTKSTIHLLSISRRSLRINLEILALLSRGVTQNLSKYFSKERYRKYFGTVQIKKVAREPGERAKIAVFSNQGGVDPVGACVGQKGIRVQTVTEELGGLEKIDIIQWNQDDKLFMISALSPAKITNLELDHESKKAKVFVNSDQAPLAIGRGGVNVNLAAALSGYDITIVQDTVEGKEKSQDEKKEAEKTQPAKTDKVAESPAQKEELPKKNIVN